MPQVDPITLQVINHALVATAEEMKINLMRASYNPIIYEVLDFSVGLFDPDGEMVAQAAGLTIFLGNLSAAVKTVISDVRERDEEFVPGDVYLINDTYVTGTHLSDVTAVAPVFWRPSVPGASTGQVLLGFTAARAHWLDVGGHQPGGWFSNTTEIYQEGLRLRSVRLYRGEECDPFIFRILNENVRYPREVLGDLRAQVGACRTGARRWQALADKFGAGVVPAAVRALHLQGERKAREAIRKLPKGEFSADGFLDDDGVAVDRPTIRVRVEVKEDEMVFDLKGSSQQCVGPINCGPQTALAACRIAFKTLTDPFSPGNDGYFRPLRLILPDDCFLNARPPAPASMYGSGPRLLIELIIRALSTAIPDRVVAGQYGDVCTFALYRAAAVVGARAGGSPEGQVGSRPIEQGRTFTFIEPEAGGWGAGPERDGENVLIVITNGDTRNIPVEILEHKFPLRVEQYALRADSGGAGSRRGGLGHVRAFKLLEPLCLTATFERSKCPPWGLFGGLAGVPNRVVLNPGTSRERIIQKVTGLPLEAGDIVSAETGGGGGYGFPADRDPQNVLRDIRDGYVSTEAAARLYGVVLKEGVQEVDAEATHRRRMELILEHPECARILRRLSKQGRATEEDLARSLSLDLTFVRWALRLLQRHYLVMEVTAREDLRIGVHPPETRFCLNPEAQDNWARRLRGDVQDGPARQPRGGH